MNLQVTVRNVYGEPKVYPVNDTAKTLADLAGHKTLTQYDIQTIRQLPGVTVEVVSSAKDIPAWLA